MRHLIAAVVGLSLVFVASSKAEAKQHRYLGHHPIAAKKAGGGYCYIEFPHVHAYAPHQTKVLYRERPEGVYFVGDPIAHGYDGERHSYHGAHPVYVEQSVVGIEVVAEPKAEWCYIKGPHFHSYVAPPEAKFEVKGDVQWYVGAYPPEFKAEMTVYAPINEVYAEVEYVRPVIEVEPPSAYVDVIVAPIVDVSVGGGAHVVGGAHVGGGAHVTGGASLEVHIPTPSLEVHIGGGGRVHHGEVYERKHKHKKYKKGKKRKRGKGWSNLRLR